MGILKPYCSHISRKGGQNMNTLFVGIDISSTKNVVCFMDGSGNRLANFSVDNNKKGAKQLILSIIEYMEKLCYTKLSIGLEATSIYGDLLIYELRQNSRLSNFILSIHLLNPLQVNRFKKIYPDLQKNDFIDAFVIADHLRFGRITDAIYHDDYRYKALQLLTRARFSAVKNLIKEKQRFNNYLFIKCSSLKQKSPISPTSATMYALVEAFDSVDDIVYASLEDIAAFVDKHSRSHFSNSKTIATAIKQAADMSYHLPKTVNNSINQAIAISLASIRALEKQIKMLDKAIEENFRVIPNTLTSIPGIGAVYSAGIIAELGNVNRFHSQASIAKFAGLVWTQYQSGNFEAENTHLISGGNRSLRYYLVEAANSVRRCDPEFNRYYKIKYNEVNKNNHKRAIVLTARKLVRLVFRLLKDNRLYKVPEL
jgi:transposase